MTAAVPPQNLEAEESVLGACLLSQVAIDATCEILQPGDFYRHNHGAIYQAILDVTGAGQPVDAITLADHLDKHGALKDVGGAPRIAELAALVPTTANAAHYARIVKDAATLRRITTAGQRIVQLARDREDDAAALVDQAQQITYELQDANTTDTFQHVKVSLQAAWERITDAYTTGKETTGVATGIQGLDRITSGLQPGNMIVVAARPSMGKSALALTIARNVAVNGGTVAVFSLEMSRDEIAERLLAMTAEVELARLRRGKVSQPEWSRLAGASQTVSDLPVYVEDRGSITTNEIRAKARRLKSKHGLALIVVDYLQLLAGGKAENRVAEVTMVSRAIKLLAADLNTPVIAVSQLSRSLETRPDKRPMLSDLRESGGIEQDADLVVFVYRDHYYQPDTADPHDAELIVAKQRNGPIGPVPAVWHGPYATFKDAAHA